MRPIWEDGKLTVELHVPDKTVLIKAREIGKALVAMNQAKGIGLVDAVDSILCPLPPDETEETDADN
jgi:hypothetical protein